MAKDTKLSGQPVLAQLLSFIPKDLLSKVVEAQQSDYYFKKMTKQKHLAFMLYGVISKSASLNSLCRSLQFLDKRLGYIGVDQIPSKSTLSYANIHRNSEVFAELYYQLYQHYNSYLTDKHVSAFLKDEVALEQVELFDSSTISLFTDIFRGAGRTPMNGKKKGGLKIHTKLPLTGLVPDLVVIEEAAKNDKDFLGQLVTESGKIYVFDKGYVNYQKWEEWTKSSVFYLTRLNENAKLDNLIGQPNQITQYADGGIIADQIAQLGVTQVRVVTFKDFESGKVLRFVTNLIDCQAETIAYLYKSRWSIEVLFKQLKQNFELGYFYSDKAEGIKSQVWIALIANLIFTVIHRQVKECELFSTIVAMARSNLGSYMSLIRVVESKPPSGKNRQLEIVQLNMFQLEEGGVFQNLGKST